jgi:hypothetical protein
MAACKCGTCASCKANAKTKNSNMKRDQSLTARKKNSLGQARSKNGGKASIPKR